VSCIEHEASIDCGVIDGGVDLFFSAWHTQL
jgi:hypothetical protein